ncbi:MAG: hypothetical protein IJF79_09700 [Clostridia bacterium]|nr:hypothetical protein [Clostridia bacterium]
MKKKMFRRMLALGVTVLLALPAAAENPVDTPAPVVSAETVQVSAEPTQQTLVSTPVAQEEPVTTAPSPDCGVMAASIEDQNTQQPPAVSTPDEETPDENDTRHPTLGFLDISKDFPDVMDYEEAIHLIPDSMQTFRIERIPVSDLSGIFVTPEESGMYHFDCGYLKADSSPATLEVSYDLSDIDDDVSIVNGHYYVPVSIENFAFSRYFYLEKGHTYYLVLDTLQSSGEGFYTVMFSQVTNLMEGFQYMDGFHYPGQKNYYEVIASEEGDYTFSLMNNMSSELDMSAWVFIDDTGSTEYLFQDVTENTVHLKAEQKIMLICTDPGIGGGLSYNLCIEKTN